MTARPPGPPRRSERRAARRLLRPVLLLLAAALVFLLGVALGRALEAGSDPGETQTLVRTLEPATLAPPTRTVTVTTATP